MRQNVRVSVKRGPDDCRWQVWMADGKMRMEKKNIYKKLRGVTQMN